MYGKKHSELTKEKRSDKLSIYPKWSRNLRFEREFSIKV